MPRSTPALVEGRQHLDKRDRQIGALRRDDTAALGPPWEKALNPTRHGQAIDYLRRGTMESLPRADDAPLRDATYWAHQITTLKVGSVPAGAVNLNVEGRRVVGPLQGFGPMWQKTYKVLLTGASVVPTEVIKVWKEQFPRFWPRGNRFYAPLTGIAPGEVALLSLTAGGMPLSTGVLVLYADDESFTLMTPQGHMFAW